ncbi:hypothetical protein NPIL_482261 [Nephila pilipes]|uniref:Uncharacterized protein n=1 Tax=Nephila pilipes TaxID=299642 RepID=A0A8X6IL60_NEPPI|nr:hypothetical protein NPIL_482261 [Nephila pilipes]
MNEISKVNWSSYQQMLTENLRKRYVAAKFVLCLLIQDQNPIRLNMILDLKIQIESDPNLGTKLVMRVGVTVMAPRPSKGLTRRRFPTTLD